MTDNHFPILAKCNKNMRRNVVLVIIISLLIILSKSLLCYYTCIDCNNLRCHVTAILYLIPAACAIFVFTRDDAAIITISKDHIDVVPINMFGPKLGKPVRHSMAEFDHLAIKSGLPPLGGVALRIVFRGKPGFRDVAFDPPENLTGKRRLSGLPAIKATKDYWRELGIALNIRTLDDVWGSGDN